MVSAPSACQARRQKGGLQSFYAGFPYSAVPVSLPARQETGHRFNPWVYTTPWRRKRTHPWPGLWKSCGQWNCSPWGHRRVEVTEWLSTGAHRSPGSPWSGDGPVKCCVQPEAHTGAHADSAAVQPTPAGRFPVPAAPGPPYSLRIPGGSPALCSEGPGCLRKEKSRRG